MSTSSQQRIAVNCSYCRRLLEVNARLSGENVRCNCGTLISIPIMESDDRSAATIPQKSVSSPKTSPSIKSAARPTERFRMPKVGSVWLSQRVTVILVLIVVGLGTCAFLLRMIRSDSEHSTANRHPEAHREELQKTIPSLEDELKKLLDFSISAEQLKPLCSDSGWGTLGGGTQYEPGYSGQGSSWPGYMRKLPSAKYEWWLRNITLANGEVTGKVRYKFFPKGPMYEIDLLVTWPSFVVPDPPRWTGENPGDIPESAQIVCRHLQSLRTTIRGSNDDGMRSFRRRFIKEPAPREPKCLFLSATINGLYRKNVSEFAKGNDPAELLATLANREWENLGSIR